jgi:23S rRNA (adenine1618-N6)-methyltransferase
MVTPGGEVAFITRLINESLSPSLKSNVQWFTTMLGKHSSLAPLINLLKSRSCSNYAVTEFVVGGKTKRWGLGWSWGSRRPGMKVVRGLTSLPKHLLPLPSDFSFAIKLKVGATQILELLRPLDLHSLRAQSLNTVNGTAHTNVWSRSARRRATLESNAEDTIDEVNDDSDSDDESPEPALSFRINVSIDDNVDGSMVTVRWLQGNDHVLFESFCGWLKRKLGEVEC